MCIRFTDASITTPQGLIEDLHIQIRNCLIPNDFQVVEMSNDSYMPLILGRPFLPTAGALVDLTNKRIFFLSKIDKKIFYNSISDSDGDNYGSSPPYTSLRGRWMPCQKQQLVRRMSLMKSWMETFILISGSPRKSIRGKNQRARE